MSKTLFVSDLDGTLLNPNARLSERTEKVLNSLISDGLLFSVASARSIISAGDILDNVRFTLPGIFMNGVLFCDIQTKQTLDYVTIDSKVVQRMIDIFYSFNRPPTVFTFNGANYNGKYSTDICVKSGELKHDGDREFYENRKNKYTSYYITENFDTENVIYMNGLDDFDTMKLICDRISEINGVSCELYMDIYTKMWLLECHAAEATKAKRALQLKEMLGADHLTAFGDNYNDIELLKCADTAVVVDNAPSEVKKYADVIIPSNENDGVAGYLSRI